jgi:hypothetical protein
VLAMFMPSYTHSYKIMTDHSKCGLMWGKDVQVLIGVHLIVSFFFPAASQTQHLLVAGAVIGASSLLGIEVNAESLARTVKQVWCS